MVFKFKINEKKIYVLILTITLIIMYNIGLNIIFVSNYKSWLQVFLGVVLLMYVYDAIIMYYARIKLLSLPFLFVTLSYIFHMGQVFLNAFFQDYKFISSNYLDIYSSVHTKESLLFSLNIIQIVTVSMVVFNTSRKFEKGWFRFSNISPRQMKLMAWLICMVTIPLRTVYTLSGIEMVRDNTYLESIIDGYSGVYIQFANFLIIGFVLLLLAYEKSLLKSTIVLIIEVLFLLWTMMSGARIYALLSILILGYCYFTVIKKINFKNIIFLTLLGYVLLQGITAITQLRTTRNFTISAVIGEMLNPSGNFLLQLLDEFGGTQYTVIVTLAEVPEFLDYHYGLSYIKAWALAGINVGGCLEHINQEIQYTYLFSRRYAFGGSYIGELYYNFGYCAYLFAIGVGILVVKLSNQIDYYLQKREYINFSLLIMPMWAMIQWVRGYFDGFTRATIWGACFILLMYALVRRIKTVK